MIWWILLIGLIAVLFGAFAFALCQVAGRADDMMEAQMREMAAKGMKR